MKDRHLEFKEMDVWITGINKGQGSGYRGQSTEEEWEFYVLL